jgi:hypothetical protein
MGRGGQGLGRGWVGVGLRLIYSLTYIDLNLLIL